MKWLEYLSWRSKLALRAYSAAFGNDHKLQTSKAYENALNIHAFFTHAAMVARVFIPAIGANEKTKARAEDMKRLVGLHNKAFANCLDARNDLDHFDERIDAFVELPQSIVSNATYIMNSRSSLARLNKPALLLLIYIRDEHAIVTYSKKGKERTTALDPIWKELHRVESWHLRVLTVQEQAAKDDAGRG